MLFKPANVVVVATLLASISSSFASEIFSDKVLSFEIKPNVCIVKKVGQDCALSYTVLWQTIEPMDICLVEQQSDRSPAVLQCWHNVQAVDETADVVLQQSITLDLIDEQRQVLAQEDLQVNAAQPKNRRRRLRSAWSLF